MTTPDSSPAPRVRASGPGGFEVATRRETGTPWWRLKGVNGEILGHSQTYASLSNAARGVDDAERMVIQQSHEYGPVLWDVLRELDILVALEDDPDNPALLGPKPYVFPTYEDLRAVLAIACEGVPLARRREALVSMAACLVLSVVAHDETADGDAAADGVEDFEGGES